MKSNLLHHIEGFTLGV